jgi:vitamin B12/bleomycin/antimicrobial peptide transport system ATP-binding/permease protein
MLAYVTARLSAARAFFSKLWALARPYWFAENRQPISILGLSFSIKESWVGRGLLLLIFALSVFNVVMAKLLNDWNARFFNALQEKDARAFWYELKYWVVLAAIYIIIAVYRLWLTQLLTIRWRRWLSQVYFHDWLSERTYYHLEVINQGTDNPEQRIEQDCAMFATQTINLTVNLLLQAMTFVTFATVLWGLSGSFIFPILGGVAIPGYMMWAAIGYALVGSWLTYRIGRPLVHVNFSLERFNADFRYRMTRIRENAESIALYRGEGDEERGLRGAFMRIYGTWWEYMKYTKRLTGLTAFYGQAASVFPILMAAPQYFAGVIQLGVLTQTAGAFGEVQGSLSWFIESYGMLAAWKATLDRLTTFSEAMRMSKAPLEADQTFTQSYQEAGNLVLEHVYVRLPDGTPLLDNVNVTVAPGDSIVVRGASGSGKTTLFRVLAGLWPFGRGHVGLPADARVLFLPQKPYLPLGTLRTTLSYPEMPECYSDEECREALAACGLSHLVSRLDDAGNWSMILSGGEQQRLAFARAILYKPAWLFLDEASSQLDEETEKALYQLLRQRLPLASVISIAHKPTAFAFHRRQIVVDPSKRVVAVSELAS